MTTTAREPVLGGIAGAVTSFVFVFLTHVLYARASVLGNVNVNGFGVAWRSITAYYSWLILVAFGAALGVLVGFFWARDGRSAATRGTDMSDVGP